jgi:hypothetical protein
VWLFHLILRNWHSGRANFGLFSPYLGRCQSYIAWF